MKFIFYLPALCAGLSFLTACASFPSSQTGAGDLTGSVWGLSTLEGQELVPGSGITALFTAGGKLGGASGCNQYSGSYTLAGNSLEISSPLSSTMMACLPALMDQETAYLKTLAEVKTFSITGDQLTLKGAENKNLLVYKAQSQALAGTTWVVIGYNNGKQAVTSVLTGTSLTATFEPDETIAGNSGCNQYSGPYKTDGNKIAIGPLSVTKKACAAPAGAMEQEALYLAALQSATTYQIEGTTLELRTQDGALAANFSQQK